MKVNGIEAVNVVKIVETIHGDMGYAKEQLVDKTWKHDLWVPENKSTKKYFAVKLKNEKSAFVEISALQKIVTEFGGGKIDNNFAKKYQKDAFVELAKKKRFAKSLKHHLKDGDKEWFFNLSEEDQKRVMGL